MAGFTYQDIGACNCPAATCSVTYTVAGCTTQPGVTVTLSGTPGILASGTTNGSGQVTFTGIASGSGPYTVAVTGQNARYAAFTPVSGGSGACPTNPQTLNLTPATGYACYQGCQFPVKTTLHATYSGAGVLNGSTFTMNYGGGNWGGGVGGFYGGTFTLVPGIGLNFVPALSGCFDSFSLSVTCPLGFSITATAFGSGNGGSCATQYPAGDIVTITE